MLNWLCTGGVYMSGCCGYRLWCLGQEVALLSVALICLVSVTISHVRTQSTETWQMFSTQNRLHQWHPAAPEVPAVTLVPTSPCRTSKVSSALWTPWRMRSDWLRRSKAGRQSRCRQLPRLLMASTCKPWLMQFDSLVRLENGSAFAYWLKNQIQIHFFLPRYDTAQYLSNSTWLFAWLFHDISPLTALLTEFLTLWI